MIYKNIDNMPEIYSLHQRKQSFSTKLTLFLQKLTKTVNFIDIWQNCYVNKNS